MPFTLVAFRKEAVGTSLSDLDAVLDGALTKAGSSAFFTPGGMRVVAAFACCSGSLNQALLISPTFLRGAYPEVRPLQRGPVPVDEPNVNVLVDRPLAFVSTDTLGARVADSSVGTVTAIVLVWLESLREPVPPGETFWVRYTSATAAAVGIWTTLDIDMQALPEGTYVVCGMEHVCTDCVAARLVFPGAPLRPGTLGQSILGDQTHRIFYDDSLGVWGRFPSFTPPTVEVLAQRASTDHVGFLRLLKDDAG